MTKTILKNILLMLGYALKALFFVSCYGVQAVFYLGLYAAKTGKALLSETWSKLVLAVGQRLSAEKEPRTRDEIKALAVKLNAGEKGSRAAAVLIAAVAVFVCVGSFTNLIFDLTLAKFLGMVLPAFFVEGVRLGAMMLAAKGIFIVVSQETQIVFPYTQLLELAWAMIGAYAAIQACSDPKKLSFIAAAAVGGGLYRYLWRPIGVVLELEETA